MYCVARRVARRVLKFHHSRLIRVKMEMQSADEGWVFVFRTGCFDLMWFVYVQYLLTGVVANVVELVGVGSKVRWVVNGCGVVLWRPVAMFVARYGSNLLILIIGDRT